MLRLAVIGLVALAADAYAGSPPRLADARKHYAELDFELVLADADAVLANGAARVSDRVEALFLRGSSLVVLDRDDDANAAFVALLTLDPSFRASPKTPPRIRAAFEGARAAHLVRLEEELATAQGDKLRAVKLDLDPPKQLRGGLPLTLRVRLSDPFRLIDHLVLGYRRRGQRDFALLSTPSTANPALVIPGVVTASDRPYKLEWYVQGIHANGARVRRLGDETQPRTFSIDTGHVPEPASITSRWWFWAGLVTLAGSAVAVPILIDRSRDVGPQTIVVGR